MLWLESSTPLLLNGKLYIPVMHRDTSARGGDPSMAGSYLLCLDAGTGSELWRVVRPTDAVEESREAYTTPIAIPVAGKTQIVLMGGDHVTGHDADTGKELWRTPTYNPTKITSWRTVASATYGDGLVYASAPKDGNLFAAVPNDGSAPQAKLAWTSKDVRTDVCAPLFYKGQLFVLNGDGKKTLYCLDPKTGDKRWSTDLGGRPVFRASPTGADDKIYCMNETGDVFVVSAADGKVLSKTSLNSESPARSTITAANGAMYVRTADRLYSFGKK
jgi:outer membrane protein assembly factor BamB